MFAVRRLTYNLSPRFYQFFSHRSQSNSSKDVPPTSSSDQRKKSSIDTKSWATSDTNALIKQLAARIKAGGPITVADFMRESLLNPKHVC